ncbi:MAG: hypothetical protein KAT71_06980, partial [Gammaproteobacteria bacterium]|nr:hypothetical protein [Gammaproteobacteria bacterium]
AAVKQSVAQQPPPKTPEQWGLKLLKENKLEKAMLFFNKILEDTIQQGPEGKRKEDGLFLRIINTKKNLAVCHENLKQYDEAINLFPPEQDDILYELRPDIAALLGEIHHLNNQPELAINMFQNAISGTEDKIFPSQAIAEFFQIINIKAKYNYAILKLSRNATSLQQEDKLLKYLKQADAHGYSMGAYYIGAVYLFGLGAEKNLNEAEEWLLRAAEAGVPHSHLLLAIVELNKVANKKEMLDSSQKIRDHIHQAAETGDYNADDLIADDSNQKLELVAGIKKVAADFSAKNIPSHDELDEIFFAADTKPSAKICKIIAICNQSNFLHEPLKYALAIKRLGILVNEIRNNQAFLETYLPKIWKIVATNYREDAAYRLVHLTNLIEGISKLYLSFSNPGVKKIIADLYQKASTAQSLYWRSLVTIIFAATRLQKDTKMAPCLSTLATIALTDKHMDQYDTQATTNLIYSLAVLHNSGLLHELNFKQLIEKTTSLPLAIDRKSLHQAFLACSYFADAPSAPLTSWEKHLTNSQIKDRGSLLQKEIFNFIKPYYPNAIEEKLFVALPVDISTKIGKNTILIIQVDGSTHFLVNLDHNNTITDGDYNQKDEFHDALLKKSLPEVFIMHIPYYDWVACNGDKAKTEYLQKKHKELGLQFEPGFKLVSKKGTFANPVTTPKGHRNTPDKNTALRLSGSPSIKI